VVSPLIALLIVVSIVILVVKTASVAVPVTETPSRQAHSDGGGNIKHQLVRSCTEARAMDPHPSFGILLRRPRRRQHRRPPH